VQCAVVNSGLLCVKLVQLEGIQVLAFSKRSSELVAGRQEQNWFSERWKTVSLFHPVQSRQHIGGRFKEAYATLPLNHAWLRVAHACIK
jgi:hypothetical protein